MDMTREIRIEEGKLKVVFEIQENGVVELKQFDPAGRMDVKERDRGEEDFYPITEIQITGRGTRGMHAYKHNSVVALRILYIRAMRFWKMKKEKNW